MTHFFDGTVLVMVVLPPYKPMIKNYLKIALRTLHKNPVFSIINVTGLMIGLVSSILIGLWVADELSWDNFHENKERLHRVYLNGKNDQGVHSRNGEVD